MDNLTIGNTFKFFFVQKSNEKYYEEVFNKVFILIYVLSISSRLQVLLKIEFHKKKKKNHRKTPVLESLFNRVVDLKT